MSNVFEETLGGYLFSEGEGWMARGREDVCVCVHVCDGGFFFFFFFKNFFITLQLLLAKYLSKCEQNVVAGRRPCKSNPRTPKTDKLPSAT